VKLVSFAPAGGDGESTIPQPRLGLLTERGIGDLAPAGIDSLAAAMAAWPLDPDAVAEPLDGGAVRLLAPIPHPGKIICVGLNYHDHCREQGIEAPAYPMLFAKFANAVTHPGEPVTRPRATERLDLECELAVVIGRAASHVGPDEALEAVFGYTILNDVTMRDLQREDRQWLRAKGADGFAPIGPAVVTRDELGDGRGLRVRSVVNGEIWQDSTTDEMIFDVPTLVAFVSRTIRLEPGDLVSTGTPAGVGHFQDPPRYLSGGDVMRCEIEGIGILENPVVDELPRTDDHAAAAGVVELMGLAR
jgi:2-keto-4-pentenoate hydratase/2-oxohepta-3-ene-1,7-dioic acid hydratase in catechol pathway